MVNDQDESDGLAYGKPETKHSFGEGLEVNFLPPISLDIDAPEQRVSKLADIVAGEVIPRLLSLYGEANTAKPDVPADEPRTSDIVELARLVIGPDNDDAADYILKLRDGGVSLDRLHIELLEPTARHLGELWTEDKLDFIDVTIGVSKLQRLVQVFGGLDHVPAHDAKRRVLLAIAPGDQHSMGYTMLQNFLRAAGWHVWTCATANIEDAADITAQEWVGVVGFSLSSDLSLDRLREAVQRVRELSRNRNVGIMVGGSAFARNPDWVESVGADGTAANGPAAVILAKKLLMASLLQPEALTS